MSWKKSQARHSKKARLHRDELALKGCCPECIPHSWRPWTRVYKPHLWGKEDKAWGLAEWEDDKKDSCVKLEPLKGSPEEDEPEKEKKKKKSLPGRRVSV